MLTVGGLDMYGYRYRLIGANFTNAWSPEIQAWKYVRSNSVAGTTATAYCTNHGFSNGDVIEVKGADSLCPYYNGIFPIFNVTANTFDYTVTPGTNLLTSEPLSITWPRGNEHATDEWCRRPEQIRLTGLNDGTYRVEVIRKNSMDEWQSTNAPTVSRSWTVGLSAPRLICSYNGTSTLVRFQAKAGQAYTMQYSDSLSPANWQTLNDIPAPDQDGELGLNDNNLTGNMRFYRLLLR
jgi:hypothetical protein